MPKESSNYIYTLLDKKTKPLYHPSTIPYWGLFITVICLVIAIWSTIRLDYITKHQNKISMQDDLDVHGKNLDQLEQLEARQLNGILHTSQQPNITSLGTLHKDLNMQGHNLLDFNMVQSNTIEGTLIDTNQSNIAGIGPLSHTLEMQNHNIYNIDKFETNTIKGVLKNKHQPDIHALGPQTTDWDLNDNDIINGGTVEAQSWYGDISYDTACTIHHTAPLIHDINVNGNMLCDTQWIDRPLYSLSLTLPNETSTKAITWGVTKHPSLFSNPYIQVNTNTSIGDTFTILKSGIYALNICVTDDSISDINTLALFINYNQLSVWDPNKAEIIYTWSRDNIYTPTAPFRVSQGDTIHIISEQRCPNCKVELNFIQ